MSAETCSRNVCGQIQDINVPGNFIALEKLTPKLNQNNRTKYIILNLRKIDSYVIVTRVKLSVELDALLMSEQQIFIQL